MSYTKGNWEVVTENRTTPTIETDKKYIASLCVYGNWNNPDNWNIANAQLISASPDLLIACKEAQRIIKLARKYFPKSIQDSNTFDLENTNASISKAIQKAEGEL